MRRTIVILFCIIVTAFACSKDQTATPATEVPQISLYYRMKMCNNPWPIGTSDDLTIKNAVHYIDSVGLPIAAIGIKNEAVIITTCVDCSCFAGKSVVITTFNKDNVVAGFKMIGFSQY